MGGYKPASERQTSATQRADVSKKPERILFRKSGIKDHNAARRQRFGDDLLSMNESFMFLIYNNASKRVEKEMSNEEEFNKLVNEIKSWLMEKIKASVSMDPSTAALLPKTTTFVSKDNRTAALSKTNVPLSLNDPTADPQKTKLPLSNATRLPPVAAVNAVNNTTITRPVGNLIDEINSFDVMWGKGNGVRKLNGNILYRQLIRQSAYSPGQYSKHGPIVGAIVNAVQSRGGRFLQRDKMTGSFYEVDDLVAKQKVAKALYFRSAFVMNTLESSSATLPTVHPVTENSRA